MTKHIPVLLNEALDALSVKPKGWYIDATFGRGGHTHEILKKGGKVIAFDWDPEAIEYGEKEFSAEIQAGNLILINRSFSAMKELIQELRVRNQIEEISGILFDFGTSTEQLKSHQRGFSFEGEGPLDMRMNPELGVTAADLLAVIPEGQLAKLFLEYGGEERGKAIAKAIKVSPTPVKTTSELRRIIEKVNGARFTKLHPATKVFQALRIAVNSELDQIDQSLPQAFGLLKPGGLMVTIAFHEGEDRLAKKFIKNLADSNQAEILPRVTASELEVKNNPRSRSAKLRAAIKK